MINRSWYLCPVIKSIDASQKQVYLPSPPTVMIGEIIDQPQGFWHVKLSAIESESGELTELHEVIIEVMPEVIQVL
jgi:hypothetical protein